MADRTAAETARPREIRRVVVGGMLVPLGVVAGADHAHPFTADGHVGSMCVACFGWYDDPRHPFPPSRGGRRG